MAARVLLDLPPTFQDYLKHNLAIIQAIQLHNPAIIQAILHRSLPIMAEAGAMVIIEVGEESHHPEGVGEVQITQAIILHYQQILMQAIML